ncbi:MAG: DUF2958 domain-containing protein [Rhodobacteraceae bacterium]|nr:DUF2958 domain-containing protein [Paracoccaceae bacterium]
MMLITKAIRKKLLANNRNRDGDHVPVVKFFDPCGAATWLITDMDEEDNDLLFGLCDLGHGFPELGYVRLSELQSVRSHLNTGIERDMWFSTPVPISKWAEAARGAQRIVDPDHLV